MQPRDDHILELSPSLELDYQRFCKYECEPTQPARGAACSRRRNNRHSARRHDFVHFLRAKKRYHDYASTDFPQPLV